MIQYEHSEFIWMRRYRGLYTVGLNINKGQLNRIEYFYFFHPDSRHLILCSDGDCYFKACAGQVGLSDFYLWRLLYVHLWLFTGNHFKPGRCRVLCAEGFVCRVTLHPSLHLSVLARCLSEKTPLMERALFDFCDSVYQHAVDAALPLYSDLLQPYRIYHQWLDL